MAGISDLPTILSQLNPCLSQTSYVFCNIPHKKIDKLLLELNPLSYFRENESVSLIMEKQQADQANILYENTFKKISLQVHSSLTTVGLTATVASALAAQNISCNIVAAYHHDHIFVAEKDAIIALSILEEISKQN